MNATTLRCMREEFEKIALVTTPELLLGGAAGLLASTHARNIAGDVAGKITPRGGKERAEKSGRRIGLLAGGALGALGTVAIMRRKHKIMPHLKRYLDEGAADIAFTYGVPVAGAIIGSSGGYPVGMATAGVHSMMLPKKTEKK